MLRELLAEKDEKIEELIKPPRVVYARPDWNKIRPSNGDADLEAVIAERYAERERE
jgi:hypothetical protein